MLNQSILSASKNREAGSSLNTPIGLKNHALERTNIHQHSVQSNILAQSEYPLKGESRALIHSPTKHKIKEGPTSLTAKKLPASQLSESKQKKTMALNNNL